MEVAIVSDDVPFISSFYCPEDQLDMIMELAAKRLAEIKLENNYTNPRIIVRTPIADV